MKKLLLVFITTISIISTYAQNGKSSSKTSIAQSAEYLPNKIIVKLKPESGAQIKTLSVGKAIGLSSELIDKIEQKFPAGKVKSNAVTLKRQEEYGLSRIYEITYSGKQSLLEVIETLKKNPNVEYAEPVYISHVEYLPNDANYPIVQSYLNQVNAPLAWNLIKNGPRVIIAIVDSGSDLDHEDLAANIYFNTADPINGLDDDGDGYIDNYQGWDFAGSSSSNIVEDNNPTITQAASDHGVHVSGIASAVTDNGKGVSSIAFNSAKLLIVKTAADDNGTDIIRGYEGIKYAADHGAQVINCSWGSESQSYYGQDIVNYAMSKGCLIVAAAGNSGGNVPQYPAGYPGVLAVANVQTDDIKATSSNFGPYVSISAPGTSIYSTILNTYGYKSGTSMASPVVSSAAALVKSYFPALSMQQVGEQLRVTADNIDGINTNYKNQLGKGRLNVYRALTESQPSIKKQSITFTDKGSGTFPTGDTVSIYASFKNFLNPVTNLTITLKSDDSYVVVTQAQATITSLGTLATQNIVGPFKFLIKPGTPENYTAELRFEYSANNNSYTDFEGFVIQLNRDYLNLQTTTIATTVTSNGKIGFIQAGGEEGTLGFQYKGEQLLYEAALMIGNSANRVSDNARSTESSSNDDFVSQVKVQSTSKADTVKAVAEFNDSGSSNPLNIYAKQRSFIINDQTSDNYLITEYEVFNQTNTTLNNVYIGMFNDWDINGGSTNATEFDQDNNIAYVYDKSNLNLPYAAVKLLSSANPAYYPLSNRLSGNLLANDDFNKEEKFKTLSNGIAAISLGTSGNGTDVSFVTGYGPFTIPANESVKVAFAYIGGENLAQVKQTATVAQANYNTLSLNIDKEVSGLNLFSYYSASENLPYVSISLPQNSRISLGLYNLLGQQVELIKTGMFVKGNYNFQVLHTDSLASGVYFYKLEANDHTKTFKTVIVH